jgi:hypothetical protein
MNISKYIGKTFPAGKTVKELGLDLTRKFVVVRAFGPFLEEDVVTIACDEDDAIPIVRRIHDGRTNWIPLDNLAYLEEEDEKIEYTVDPEKDVDTTDFLSGMNYIPRVGDRVYVEAIVEKIDKDDETLRLDIPSSISHAWAWWPLAHAGKLTLISRAPRTLTKAEAEKMLSEHLNESITII